MCFDLKFEKKKIFHCIQIFKCKLSASLVQVYLKLALLQCKFSASLLETCTAPVQV